MTDRAKYLDLANTVGNHPWVGLNPQGYAAAGLISAGARHVGFARIAAGMAGWAAEPGGIEQLQARLSDEQFDTMYLAPISFAASAALTCLDVCAAAAYRLFVGAPRNHEFDLRKLTDPNRPVPLPPNLTRWATNTTGDPDYANLLLVRKRMVHRDMPSKSEVGSVTPTTTYPIGDGYVAPQDATLRFARIAERRYPAFVDAVLADLA
ncbi:hypothetical protein ACWFPY_25150 [Nocardia fluminea]